MEEKKLINIISNDSLSNLKKDFDSEYSTHKGKQN